MRRSDLMKLGGVAAALGGVLMLVDVVLHLFADDTLQPEALGGIPHEVWHIPGMLALPLVLLGLFAVYARQSENTWRIGLWGFALLVVGITAGAIYSTIFHGIFLPAIESLEEGLFELLVDNTTAAQFYRGVVVQGIGLGLGAVLFGVATIRAQVFSRITGWLLIAAAVFAAANEAFAGAQLISRALFAATFIWFGLELRRLSSTTT